MTGTVVAAACSSPASDAPAVSGAPTTIVPSSTSASVAPPSASPPTTATRTGAAPAVAPQGRYAVGRRELTVVDAARPTPRNGSYPGAPTRTIRSLIWYPAASGRPGAAEPSVDAAAAVGDGPYPLILLSHGWTANALIYQPLALQWASAGYVVVAPNYPLSYTSAPGGPTVADVKSQPGDASFVTTAVLARDAALLGGIVDRTRIGAVGHSLGGITTFGLAYSDCCRDRRIGAAITLAGAPVGVDDKANYFKPPAVPLFVIHGTADPLVSYAGGRAGYERAPAPKLMFTIVGGGHVAPFLGGTDALATAFYSATTAFFDRYLKDDASAIGRVERAVRGLGARARLDAALR